MQHEVVGVEDHGRPDVAAEHEAGVLREPGGDQAELAALCPEALEVRDDGGVLEEALHLVDEEPGCLSLCEVLVHAVSHLLERGEHAEHPHVGVEVVQVDVDHGRVEAHVRLAVEERQRPLDVALVAKRDVLGGALRLFEEQVVEVLEDGRVGISGTAIGLFDAAGDDGALGLREALPALGHHRRGKGQKGVYLERALKRRIQELHVLLVEGVHELSGVCGEPDAHAAASLRNGPSLAGRVYPDALRPIPVEHTHLQPDALLRVRLARARRAEIEAHGRGQREAVQDGERVGDLGLPEVDAAWLVDLERCEWHLHGDLPAREQARHVASVDCEGKDRSPAFLLAVVERLHREGGSACGGDDAVHLLVELLLGRRVREYVAGVLEELLVLAAQEV